MTNPCDNDISKNDEQEYFVELYTEPPTRFEIKAKHYYDAFVEAKVRYFSQLFPALSASEIENQPLSTQISGRVQAPGEVVRFDAFGRLAPEPSTFKHEKLPILLISEEDPLKKIVWPSWTMGVPDYPQDREMAKLSAQYFHQLFNNDWEKAGHNGSPAELGERDS